MLLRILGLLFFILSIQAFALEGELVPQSSRTLDLEEGSLFDGVLRVWPVSETWSTKQLEDLMGKNIGDAFNLVRIDSIERSTHNAEVVELRGLFALIKAVSPKVKVSLSLTGGEVQLEVRRLNMIATAPAAQKFELVDQPESATFFATDSPIALGFGGGLFLVIGLIAISKFRKVRAYKRQQQLAKSEIAGAQTRAEIEQVGRKIEVHQKLLSLPDEKIAHFKQQLDLYQYRPSWTDAQLADVRKSLESLVNDQ